MAERGSYRSVKVVLLDGPDFQRLDERPRWVFMVLKLSFGPSGIEVHYPEALAHELAEKTGASVAQVKDALDTLEAEGWIHRERNVLWIVGQLEHDPHMNWTDAKHRTAIWKHVAGLPRLPLVGAYIEAHPDWFQARTVTVSRRGGETEEKELDKAPAELLELVNEAAIPDPPSKGPRKGQGRAKEGPKKALRSTDNRIPNTEKEEELYTRAKALGAGPLDSVHSGGRDDWSFETWRLDMFEPIRMCLWRSKEPPPETVRARGRWSEANELSICHQWIKEDTARPDELEYLVRHAKRFLGNVRSLLPLNAKDQRGWLMEVLGDVRKAMADDAYLQRLDPEEVTGALG